MKTETQIKKEFLQELIEEYYTVVPKKSFGVHLTKKLHILNTSEKP